MPGLAFAIFSSCFAWLSFEVQNGDIGHFDNAVRELIHQISQPRLTQALRAISAVGSPFASTLLAVIAIVTFMVLSRRHDAVVLALTIAGANIVDHVLKVSFHRPRPTPFFDLPEPESFSFPSGHALVAFCFCAMAARLLSAPIQRLAIRSAIWITATLITLVIGFSRIYLGVHYPSDVAGGYAAGAAFTAFVILADSIYKKEAVRSSDCPNKE